LSLFPIDTEFGRKTQVHQYTCNKDYTCLEGDCPSFLRIIPGEKERPKIATVNCDDPVNIKDESSIYLVGIGGTGVVTASQVLATAAHLENKKVVSLDQTGMSQKGGSVVSHVKIVNDSNCAVSIKSTSADLYIAFDAITASEAKHLQKLSKDSIAIVSSSHIPTGYSIRKPGDLPDLDNCYELIKSYANESTICRFDLWKISEYVFDTNMMGNMIGLGIGYQKGGISVHSNSIMRAIELNGVKIEDNLLAFQIGRQLASDPSFIDTLDISSNAMNLDPVEKTALQIRFEIPDEIADSLKLRVAELCDYQNEAYAEEFLKTVESVLEKDAKPYLLTKAVIQYHFKLMAYKDEFEVARLHLKQEMDTEIIKRYGKGAKIKFVLHPPILKAIGLKNKINFGSWFRPFMGLLANLKSIRNSPLNIFAYAEVRKEERKLIDEYRSIIKIVLEKLSKENYDTALELLSLPDLVRGYEDIKLKNIKKYRLETEKLLAKIN
ncbi:MAG: 2-oxoacid:acceptor oxidoreductase family protein, partial [Lentisphaeria bacterium]|nr:2-oxoacid:acceptor oxidoreductase family protein [Lentisphaeria bacterium]